MTNLLALGLRPQFKRFYESGDGCIEASYSGKKIYAEAIAFNLDKFYLELPDHNFNQWYDWSIAVLNARKRLSGFEAGGKSNVRYASLVIIVTFLISIGILGQRKLCSSMISLLMIISFARCAWVRNIQYSKAFKDAENLVKNLELLSQAAQKYLITAYGVIRTIKVAQATGMGLKLAIPMPPVVRMEATARRRSSLQLPNIRFKLENTFFQTKINIDKAICALNNAEASENINADLKVIDKTEEKSQCTPILLASLLESELSIEDALRDFANAVLFALQRKSLLSVIDFQVYQVAVSLQSANDYLALLLDGTRFIEWELNPGLCSLYQDITDLRYSCETALIALYKSQILLSQSKSIATEHEFSDDLTFLLNSAKESWGDCQVKELSTAIEKIQANTIEVDKSRNQTFGGQNRNDSIFQIPSIAYKSSSSLKLESHQNIPSVFENVEIEFDGNVQNTSRKSQGSDEKLVNVHVGTGNYDEFSQEKSPQKMQNLKQNVNSDCLLNELQSVLDLREQPPTRIKSNEVRHSMESPLNLYRESFNLEHIMLEKSSVDDVQIDQESAENISLKNMSLMVELKSKMSAFDQDCDHYSYADSEVESDTPLH